jgi:hypothetical protein
MDSHKFALLEALKLAARDRAELRLYRRGKYPGLFPQRTRANTEIANLAIADELLEITRVETLGKTSVEWVRITQKGYDFLLNSESPVRVLEELHAVLALNEEGLPRWAAEMNERFNAFAQQHADEVEKMRRRLDELAKRVEQTLDRLEMGKPAPVANTVAWAHTALDFLDRRQAVGLGPRCPLADLFAALSEKNADLSVKDFHTGLKRLHEDEQIALYPSTGVGDTPGPEYALLDRAAVYYYVARRSANQAP